MRLHLVIATPCGANASLWKPKAVAVHTSDEHACQQAWEADRGQGPDAPAHHVRTVRGLGLIKAIPALIRAARRPNAK